MKKREFLNLIRIVLRLFARPASIAVWVGVSACVGPGSEAPAPSAISVNAIQLITYDTSTATVNLQGQLQLANTTPLNLLEFYSSSSCTGSSIGSGLASTLAGAGIQLQVSSTNPTDIYFTTNTSSTCNFAIEYDPTHAAPAPPGFTSTSPESPSRTSSTPLIFGTVSATTANVLFFDDSACTHSVGSGSASQFGSTSIGVTLTLTPNQTSSIYAEAVEPFGHASACTLLTTYTNSSSGPTPPVFVSTLPQSPSNVSTTPQVVGTVSADTVNVSIFSDPACANLLTTGTAQAFTSSGISVTVPGNASTTLYGTSYDANNNPSICNYLTTFANDTIPPAAPTFVSSNPPTPTRLTIYPVIQGTASSDTVSVTLYSNSSCSTPIGSGTRATFVGAGITASAQLNNTTPIYATSFDAAGNPSACTHLVDFVNNTIPPDPPVFSSTLPISPNNQSTTPLVLGNASIGTITVAFYSDAACTVSIGSGTAAAFTNPGIEVTVTPNATTTIYATATDDVGNVSACTLMTSYSHSTAPATAPVFTQTTPASPSNVSTTPWVLGTTVSNISSVQLFTDSACSNEIASGSRIKFETTGIQISVHANSSNPIYAMATNVYGNFSPCVYFTTYIHDNIAPYNPTFATSTPTSPNNQSTSPVIQGSAPSNPSSLLPVSTVSIYDSSLCANRIGVGTPAAYSGSGIQINVPSNATTTVYAQSSDAANNFSACTFLLNYTNDTLKPGHPIFVSASPGTPSYSQQTSIVGSLANSTDIEPAVTVSVFSDPACSSPLATGIPGLFESTGFPLTVTENATTTIYALSTDTVGNSSACTHLVDFVEEDNGPAGLTATANPNGSVSLGWSPDLVANPSPTYIVQRSLASGGPYTVIAPANLGTSYTDTSVTNNTTYYYVVAATNTTGTSKNSTEASVPVAVSDPVAPSSLVATSVPGQITLSWSGFNSALFFKVYRGTTTGGPYTLIASDLSSQGYTDNTVTNLVPYYYVVVASNPSGDSSESNEASAVPEPASQAPTGLVVVPIYSSPNCPNNGSGAQLIWSAPAYDTQFVVTRGTQSGGEGSIATVTGTTYIDCSPVTNAQDITKHNANFYEVIAQWGDQQSNPSNEVVFHNESPATLTVNPGVSSILVNWTLTAGATQYQLSRSQVSGGPYTILSNTLTSTSYTDSAVNNGSAYFYTVSAIYSDGGLSYPSLEASGSIGANPSAPNGLVMTVASNQPTLTWAAPANYNYFNIYHASSSSGPWSLLGNATANTYIDGAPQAGMNYYRVTAVWGSYETSPTNSVSFRNGVPTTISATDAATSVTLTWSAVTGASSYQVKRSPTSGGPYTVLNAAYATTSYVDSAVTAGTGYYYVVSANFSDGTLGQNSAEVSGLPGTSIIPSGLTVTGTTSGSVSLTWSKVPSATAYRVYKATASAGPYTLITPNYATNAATVSSLNPQTKYYFEVTSDVSGAWSSNSAAVSAVTDSAPPSPLLTVGNGQVALLWSAVNGASSYNVARSTDGVNFTVIASGLSSTLYTDTSATNGTLYFYEVIAVFSSGSLASLPTNGVVPGITPLAPAGLTVTQNSDGTDITLGWGLISGATTYNIYMSTTSGGPYGAPVANTSSNTGNVISSLTTGTTYYFVVTALNGTMESAYSPQIATVPMVTPAAPTALAGTGALINVAWSAVSGATLYDLQRSSDSVNFTTIVSGTSATSYADNTVSSGFPYMYRYLPYAASGVPMAISSTSTPVTPGIQPLSPVALQAEAMGTTTVALSWVQVPNVSYYNVYRGTASGGPYSLLSTIASTSTAYTDTLSSGGTYYYVVTSLNASNVESGYSNQASVSLVAAPTGLTASAGTNQITLGWSSTGGASSYILRRGTTSGGPYGELASGLTSTAYTDTNIQNGQTYYYVVDAVFSSGAVSPDSAQAQATAQENMNLVVPIELTDAALASNTTAMTFQSTQTSIDQGAYDGTLQYTFVVDAINTDASAHNALVVDSSGTTVGSATIPAGTNQPTRIHGTFTPDSGLATYLISLPATATPGLVQLFSARVIIAQTGASKTKIYIPLLASSAAPSYLDGGLPVASSNSQGLTTFAVGTIYERNVAAYSTLNDYNPWELEAVVAANSGATGAVALYDDSQIAEVSDTDTLVTESTPTLIDAPFDEGVTNFSSANDSDQYEISLACQEGCASGSVSLYKAGLWISLSNLTQAEVFFRDSLGAAPASGAQTIDLERSLINLTGFSNPTVFFQSVLNPPSEGSATIGLMTAGTADSGTSSLAAISGSTLSFNAYSKTWQRSGALSLTSGNRFVPQVNSSGGSSTLSDSTIVIDAVK